jgi:hypothetical protein
MQRLGFGVYNKELRVMVVVVGTVGGGWGLYYSVCILFYSLLHTGGIGVCVCSKNGGIGLQTRWFVANRSNKGVVRFQCET